LYSLDNG